MPSPIHRRREALLQQQPVHRRTKACRHATARVSGRVLSAASVCNSGDWRGLSTAGLQTDQGKEMKCDYCQKLSQYQTKFKAQVSEPEDARNFAENVRYHTQLG